jgi:hypothetical protein
MQHFVNCVLGKEQPIETGEDGREALKIILAAYLSAAGIRESHRSLEEELTGVPFVDTLLGEARQARVAEGLRRLIRPSIRVTGHVIDAHEPSLGDSRLGSSPDLPPGMPWPTGRNGHPDRDAPGVADTYSGLSLPADGVVTLPFLAQLRLADLKPYDAEDLLPPSGWLWFFYNIACYGPRFPMTRPPTGASCTLTPLTVSRQKLAWRSATLSPSRARRRFRK